MARPNFNNSIQHGCYTVVLTFIHSIYDSTGKGITWSGYRRGTIIICACKNLCLVILQVYNDLCIFLPLYESSSASLRSTSKSDSSESSTASTHEKPKWASNSSLSAKNLIQSTTTHCGSHLAPLRVWGQLHACVLCR